jgi:hypothetical protein
VVGLWEGVGVKDHAAHEAYDNLLASIGDRADTIGPKRLASHWPHVGKNYRGLVIAGQALQGWDPAVAGARWHAADARTPEGRAAILERTQTWFADAADPVGVIATLGNRKGSPFWTLCRDVVETQEPDGPGPWYSRFAWANVYPVGPDEPPGSPGGPLRDAQDQHVGGLLSALLDDLDARRVVIISGPEYWRYAAQTPAFSSLACQAFPLLHGGRVDGRTILVGYHPTYARRKHVGAAEYATRITQAIVAIEQER